MYPHLRSRGETRPGGPESTAYSRYDDLIASIIIYRLLAALRLPVVTETFYFTPEIGILGEGPSRPLLFSAQIKLRARVPHRPSTLSRSSNLKQRVRFSIGT